MTNAQDETGRANLAAWVRSADGMPWQHEVETAAGDLQRDMDDRTRAAAAPVLDVADERLDTGDAPGHVPFCRCGYESGVAVRDDRCPVWRR